MVSKSHFMSLSQYQPKNEVKAEWISIKVPESRDQTSKRHYNKRRVMEGKGSGHWDDQQKLKYIIFLEFHLGKLEVKHMRRTWKIFKSMSGFIGSRTADQCRSHHQKMQKHYSSCNVIIYNYKVMIKPQVYAAYFKHFLQKLMLEHFGEGAEFEAIVPQNQVKIEEMDNIQSEIVNKVEYIAGIMRNHAISQGLPVFPSSETIPMTFTPYIQPSIKLEPISGEILLSNQNSSSMRVPSPKR